MPALIHDVDCIHYNDDLYHAATEDMVKYKFKFFCSNEFIIHRTHPSCKYLLFLYMYLIKFTSVISKQIVL